MTTHKLLAACLALAMGTAASAEKIEFWTFSMKPKFTPYFDGIAQRTGKAGLCPALAKIDGLMMQQGLPVLARGRAAFNTPAHVALIAKLAETYKAGGLLKDALFAEDNFPATIDAYKGGRLGMLLAPPTAVRRIETDANDIYAKTDVAPAPLGPTGIADGGWLIHFAVPARVDAKKLPAIGEFARFLTNDTNQLVFAKQASVYPAAARAAQDPFFTRAQGPGAAEKAVPAGAVSMPYARTMYVAGVEHGGVAVLHRHCMFVPALAETEAGMKYRASLLMHYLALCAVAVVCVFPFWWTVLTILPTLAAILFTQRYFMRGMDGAVK